MNTAKRPFAALMQLILAIWMLISIVMIGQQFSMNIYQLGLISLVFTAFSQIAFGNIPATAGFRRSMSLYVRYMLIVVLIFVVSILAAPYLVAMGR
jgi:hypothetical protein